MLPVVPRVMYAEAAERNIAYGAVKEAVRQCCFLIAAGIDVRRLVELPCNARGNMVQLHAVKPGGVCIKLLRAAAEKRAHTHGRLQNVSARHAPAFQRAVHSPYHRGRRVECRQCGCARRHVFRFIQQGF